MKIKKIKVLKVLKIINDTKSQYHKPHDTKYGMQIIKARNSEIAEIKGKQNKLNSTTDTD